MDLLSRASMTDSKPFATPMASNTTLSILDGMPLPDATSYRNMVGALQCCTLTRPNIAFAVNKACQFMHSPTDTHFLFNPSSPSLPDRCP